MNQLRKYTADYFKNLHSNLVIRNSCLHFEWRLYYCDNRVRHEVSNSVIRYPISRVSWRHRNQGEKMNTRQSSSSHRRGSLKRPHQRNSRALNLLISSSASCFNGNRPQFTSIENVKSTDNAIYWLRSKKERKDSHYSHETKNWSF